MFIDSDIIFRPDDFFNLLESPHDITAGLYLKEPTLSSPEPEFMGTNLRPEDIGDEQYIKSEQSAFGWLLVRKGVIEANPSPEFWKQNTFVGDVHLDTKVRVGHRVEIVI
jgi:hypothetical protein